MIKPTNESTADVQGDAGQEHHVSDTQEMGAVDTVDPGEAHDGQLDGGAGLLIPELIEQIHSGQLDINKLAAYVRQQCVGHLTLEGFTNSEIAQVLRISERTVSRDRAAVRRDHALAPDPLLGDQLLGEYERVSMSCVQRLVRLASDTRNPAYSRLWAEEAIVRIYQRLIDMIHKLHYFEDGKTRLEGASVGISTQDPDFEEKMLRVLGKLGEE